MSRHPDLNGRLAIVTGASSGIGLEFCRELARRGCRLLMVSNQDEALRRHAEEIAAACGVECHTICTDLADTDRSIELISLWLDRNSAAPYILVNNAGIFDFAAVQSLTTRRIDLYVDLHMRTVTRLSVAMADAMVRADHGGYILNMSSMSCWMPMPGIAMYAATKAYIRAFSRALRIELLDSGINVMTACPGGIATSLFGLPPRLLRLGCRLGVLAEPDRFARKAVGRLLRGKAQWINGPLNRLSIPLVAALPQWARRAIKHQLLDRTDRRWKQTPIS